MCEWATLRTAAFSEQLWLWACGKVIVACDLWHSLLLTSTAYT